MALSTKKPARQSSAPDCHFSRRTQAFAYSVRVAQIVIITHDFDDFGQRPYLLRDLVALWRASGHMVVVAAGLEHWPDADIAILHVDQTVVPEAYVRACQRYPRVINGRATDISKRLVSRQLVRRDDDWSGPVIVKTNLNHGGMPELRLLQRMEETGQRVPEPAPGTVFSQKPYPVFESKELVDSSYWDTAGLVVEKFLPERDARGYWGSVWYFFGPVGYCVRVLRDDPVTKNGEPLERVRVDVPPELAAERERLGFDYGKFDFIMHDGQAVLLDATRTPLALRQSTQPELTGREAALAGGLSAWLES